MTPAFDLPRTGMVLRSKSGSPYELGKLCGVLTQMISSLVMDHLDHAADFRNTAKPSIIDTQEFTAAVDAQLRAMRTKDGQTDKFPDVLEKIDRKQKRHWKKHKDRYTHAVKFMFADYVSGKLDEVVVGFHAVANQQFNKGFDYGLNGMTWRLYPSVNVALEAKGEDWGKWLRTRCEDLARVSVKNNLPVFDDL
ncbi:hypothetical protein K469DRAFT_662359 [Zopfia rhizophila CBS 207.26]|uniref:Uncharacterized protein n=1 Tax=Zopfia rhizophila CBS 207.26 TaxID=1314779 RepID=A0A6A6EB90_9PEZI|nr:hypothetical protein K469DRAFT_662359 [Zopfia rhizophila CBS 207.26]